SFPDFGGELFGVERFWQEKHSRRTAISRLERFFKITGDKKDFDVWIRSSQRVGESTAAGLRHDQIGQEQIDATSAVFGEETTGIIAAVGFDHVIAETTQRPDGNVADTDVVFEDENRFGAAGRLFLAAFFIWGRRRSGHERKINLDRGAFIFFAFDAQMSAVLVDNAV